MTVLVTGGAGFVGANVVQALLEGGENVRILDNLSRPGVERNVRWLQESFGARLELVVGDIRDRRVVASAVRGVESVFHFAAQVAVTTSLADPISDFEVNAVGTLNVLEALRAQKHPASLVYTSTNKVYGHLEDVGMTATGGRYEPVDPSFAEGISEDRPLSFHSPYGCSKGTADQYVLDYARTFGLRACVFRMSCIYGPRQFGNEDQGWVAHFLIKALRGEPLVIYGDGKQVRDILFVDDLVDAFRRARDRAGALAGRAFNIGGGAANTVSLLELLEHMTSRLRLRPRHALADWRLADQRWYVSDTRAFQEATGWAPRVGPAEGLQRLHDWLVRESESRGRSRVIEMRAP